MKIINGIIRNKALIILGSLLSFISISLCFLSLTNYYAYYEQMNGIRNVFISDLDKTYVIEFSYVEDEMSFAENIKYIKDEIGDKYNISCGSFVETMSAFNELSTSTKYNERNKEAFKETFYADCTDSADIITIDRNILDFVDVGITKEMLEPIITGEEKYYPIFVGEGYKDIININDVLTDYYYGNKYVVKGYIENKNWFDSSDTFEFPVSDMEYKFLTIFSDKELLDAEVQLSTMNNIYINLDSEDIVSQIIEVASGKNIKIKLTSVNEKINTLISENKKILDIQRFFALIVLLCSVVSVSTLFCTSILTNRREYGIRLAFGETKMRLLANMMGKILVIISIMAMVSYAIVNKMFLTNYSSLSNIYKLTLRNYALPIVVGLIILFIILSAIPPLLMIHKLDLVQLIREENE